MSIHYKKESNYILLNSCPISCAAANIMRMLICGGVRLVNKDADHNSHFMGTQISNSIYIVALSTVW